MYLIYQKNSRNKVYFLNKVGSTKTLWSESGKDAKLFNSAEKALKYGEENLPDEDNWKYGEAIFA